MGVIMGKQAKQVLGDTTVPAVTLKGATVSNQPATIQLVPGAKVNLRGARAAWYAALNQYAGKPAAEFLAAATAAPPSLPKSGKAEPAQGWLRWFVSNGYVTLA